MDKTIKINLAGILFQIEDDAYKVLRDYLQAINGRLRNIPGGNETIDDIEARIAEIFQSQKGLSGIISKENVDAMISIIGKPEDFEHSDGFTESYVSGTYRRHLYRDPDNTIISGVSGGIGAYLNIDPVWIRLLFILFTLLYGIGFFIYIALWIALPNAVTDSQKRELYGEHYSTRLTIKTEKQKNGSYASISNNSGNEKVKNVENALNEVFRAIGSFFFIFFRIIIIIIGVAFVLAGFASLFALIMAFFFRYPIFFSADSFNASVLYLPDFLNLVISPSLTPWIFVLTFIIVALPLLALIYWGLKMVFWFHIRDFGLSLAALVLWVLSISAVVMILFNQGISFAESGQKNEQIIMDQHYDTLYLKVDRKISDLNFNKEITMPGMDYSLYINDKDNELYGRPNIRIGESEDRSAKIKVRKYSHGKTKKEAVTKAESLMYNYRISKDTIFVNEYFDIPTKTRWTAAEIKIELLVPAGTAIWIDKNSEDLFQDHVSNGIHSWDLGNKYWTWTEEGLEEKLPVRSK
jgi:phage shock protein PspC (stress-responsive transcriptional regulator)